MQSELAKRLVSAVFLGAIVLAATWFGGTGFRLLVALCAIVIYYEWSTIAAGAVPSARLNLFGWLIVLAGAVALAANRSDLAVCICLLGGAVAVAWGLAALRNVWTGVGVLYAILPAVALAGIRGTGIAGLVDVLFILGVVWATDIGAYFSGRFFGGPKLAVRVSPSKTWSGAAGGAVAGIVAGTLIIFFAHSGADLWVALFALCLSVLSQVGDLFESWIKRRFGAKDSSHLIPGHGGLMDRVDGLVFAAFAAYLLAAFISVSTGDVRNLQHLGGGFWTPVAFASHTAADAPQPPTLEVGSWI